MANYPLPAFQVQVDWEGTTIGFSEISGLTVEAQPIEYREGNMNPTELLKFPGLQKFSNLTMKRGIVADNNEFYAWWKETIDLANVPRRNITIKLLNEKQEPVMVWKAVKAWPVKVEGPGLKATGNEVAIESIEVAHEGLTVDNPA